MGARRKPNQAPQLAPIPHPLCPPLASHPVPRQGAHSAQQSHSHLGATPPGLLLQCRGATPPALILKSLNTGLTNNHLKVGNPYAYTFTEALVQDLHEIFQQQQAHALFLCEMGSQKPHESIDKHFKQRLQRQLSESYATPSTKPAISFVDRSETLEDYLHGALKACNLEHLQVHSLPPYAYIGDPRKLSVSPPKFFNPLPSNKQRRGVRMDVVFLPTGAQITVICNHSPSSNAWDKLTPAKKKLSSKTVCCRLVLGVARHRPVGCCVEI